jgi:hypothetical protein
MDLDEFLAESNRKARRGRRIAREMFAGALSTLGLATFLIVAAPNFMGGGPDPRMTSLPVLFVLSSVGLAWMVRILRADHEPDARAWRYRDF